MGTWGIGPFDNDTAADFAYKLDAAALNERAGLVRGVLTRTATTSGYLTEAQQAVAVAALIAAQCPSGLPVDTYGPEQPMPQFPEDLRALAAEALDRVTALEAGRVDSWVNPADERQWLAVLKGLRDVLEPPPVSHDVPLFDL